MGADARADVAETSTGDATATDGALDAAIGPDGSTSDVDAGPPLADAFSGDCGAGPFGEPLDLSCTGLYSDFATKTVAAENEAFTPGLALWSDGAEKQRWIDLPPGTTIDTSNMDEWTFPVGTKFFKEFALPLGDASTVTRIETRMLWKTGPGSWYRTTYRWSDDGTTSATELTGGQLDAGGTGYEVPTQSDCNTCHNGRLDGVLGFEAVALGQPAAAGLTLAQLETRKLLSAPPTTAPRVPGDATQATAIGWLHMNCGTSCHNAGNGLAAATGFHMRLDVDTLTTLQTTDRGHDRLEPADHGLPDPGRDGELPAARVQHVDELRLLPRRLARRRQRRRDRYADAAPRHAQGRPHGRRRGRRVDQRGLPGRRRAVRSRRRRTDSPKGHPT